MNDSDTEILVQLKQLWYRSDWSKWRTNIGVVELRTIFQKKKTNKKLDPR